MGGAHPDSNHDRTTPGCDSPQKCWAVGLVAAAKSPRDLWQARDALPVRLTTAMLMSNIETEWMPIRLLPKSSVLSASSTCGTPGRWARATSQLRIEDMTKCSSRVHGLGSGNNTGFAVDLKPKAGYGYRVNAAWPSSIRSQSRSCLACAHSGSCLEHGRFVSPRPDPSLLRITNRKTSVGSSPANCCKSDQDLSRNSPAQ